MVAKNDALLERLTTSVDNLHVKVDKISERVTRVEEKSKIATKVIYSLGGAALTIAVWLVKALVVQ